MKKRKAPKKVSAAEAKRIAKRFDQLTMFETGNAKKDYMKVPLFRNPRRKHRRCSLCHLPGHTKTSHRRKGR